MLHLDIPTRNELSQLAAKRAMRQTEEVTGKSVNKESVMYEVAMFFSIVSSVLFSFSFIFRAES